MAAQPPTVGSVIDLEKGVVEIESAGCQGPATCKRTGEVVVVVVVVVVVGDKRR